MTAANVKGWTPGTFYFGSSHQTIVAEIDGQKVVVATVADMPCIGGHDDLAAQRGCDMEHRIAHLLKAAPDLYEALELSAQAIEFAMKCVSPELAIVLGDRARFARTALEKARAGAATKGEGE